MRFNYLFICLTLVFLGCKESQEEPKEKQALIMAERSEMALLMNEMYAFNESIKQQILDGTLSTSYPEKFDNIHSAVLTNPSARDLNFESFSKLFLEAQKELFESPKEELITRYNNAINACISCHNVKCVGPIPRIKKLLIE
ncbi:MAG: hypothetical protein R2816_09390 [Flavobacteriaceae bacterium]|jgi:cytochrome c553|nr:hypothetical protein [Flavobacteriaceae bacterium]